MADCCRIELLGGLRIIHGESAITRFATRKVAALLAYLAHHCDHTHSRETLSEMLWPWAPPAAGRNSLSTALCSLRRQLEPIGVAPGSILLADYSTVCLNPDTISTDVAEFEVAIAQANKTELPDRVRWLEEAIALYRGELLTGFHEPWIAPESERLAARFIGATEALADILVEQGKTAEAISHLEHAIAFSPLLEAPYRKLMGHYAAMDLPQVALEVYDELKTALAQARGTEPSTATQELVYELKRLAVMPRATPRAAHRPARRTTVAPLPAGTVTLLAIRMPDGAAGAGDVPALRQEFRQHGGIEIPSPLDTISHIVAFARAGDAPTCAAACQLTASAAHPAMAVHTTDVTLEPDGTYPHAALEPALTLATAAHSSQIMCSESAANMIRHGLNGGLRLIELGTYRLRGTVRAERICQLDYPGGPDELPPLGAETGYRTHLPLRLTRFFGREREMSEIAALLSGNARLVTLVGGPGYGKTRLAIETASRMTVTFSGRVWFVSLADLREGGDILDRTLDPLGIARSPHATPLEQIAAALGDASALIIFDNLEQLLPAPGALSALLQRLPQLHCLVTSRRRLALPEEHVCAVAPLPLSRGISPEELLANESIQLFVDRAQLACADFMLTVDNSAIIVDLCQRLEGIPLAIELAAARVNVLAPSEILKRLGEPDLLTSRSGDQDERHRSLRMAVAWSYSLLSPELQRFFCQLSVFRGGWTADAAEAVCEEPMALDLLTELVECSLINAEHGDQPRFRMLEMIRELAHGRLEEVGELEETKNRHLEHYYAFLHSFDREWAGPNPKTALDRVEADLDNLLTAMDWCDIAPDGVAKGLSLAGALYWFWTASGRVQRGRSMIDRALRRDPRAAPAILRTQVINNAGLLAFESGDFTAAKVLHEQALAFWRSLGDKQGIAASLHNIAKILRNQGSYAEAKQLANEALTINEELGNRNWAALNLVEIAFAEFYLGEARRARDSLRRAAEILLGLGDLRQYCYVLADLGEMNWECGDYSDAQDALLNALACLEEVGDIALLVSTRLSLAKVHASLDQLEPAKALIGESLPFVRKCEAHWVVENALHAGAVLLLAQARRPSEADAQAALTRTVTLISARHESRTRRASVVPPSPLDRDLEMLRSRLSALDFQIAWEEGGSMSIEEAVGKLEGWLG